MQPPLKVLDELLGRPKLHGGWRGLVKIAHDADGDAIGCDRTHGWNGTLLIIPARIDANLALRAIARSGNEKMIPPGGRIGPAALAVMDEDRLPSAGPNGNLGIEDFIEGGF